MTVTLFSNVGFFCGPMTLVLGFELLWFKKMAPLLKTFVISALFITFVTYATVLSRIDMFRVIIFIMIFYHYGKRNLSLTHISLFFLFALALFMGAFLVRSDLKAMEALNQVQKVNMPQGFEFASNIYMYVVNNFWNMDFAIQKYVEGYHFYPRHWGYELFRGILFILHLEGGLQKMFNLDNFYYYRIIKVAGLNTVVYMWNFYKDFGAFGLYFLTAFFSVLLSIFYLNTMRYPTLFRMCIWGMCAGFIIFCFFAPIWSFWFIYFNVFVFAVAHKKVPLL
jgi:hypothetical protein